MESYRFDFRNPCHVFFIGIGGVSMSGLAAILLKEGFRVSGSDMNGKMTKTDVIRLCLEHLGVSPEETVHIGDTDDDAEGAAEAGTDFIAVCFGFGPREDAYWEKYHPAAIVHSAEEIGTFLEEHLV